MAFEGPEDVTREDIEASPKFFTPQRITVPRCHGTIRPRSRKGHRSAANARPAILDLAHIPQSPALLGHRSYIPKEHFGERSGQVPHRGRYWRLMRVDRPTAGMGRRAEIRRAGVHCSFWSEKFHE
jgi:hypothetical protein